MAIDDIISAVLSMNGSQVEAKTQVERIEMSNLDDMNLEYKYFCSRAPETLNPFLDKTKENREELINCSCGNDYRVFANGNIPIPDITLLGVVCPHCGAGASSAWMISGHSAGCFNASVRLARNF